MGRTVPTYRMASETLFQSWNDFRRALSQEEARLHASACSVAAFLDPLEGTLLSILLEQEKELERLRKKA